MALSHLMKAILLCGAAVVVTSQDLISVEEVITKAKLSFRHLDKNRDGYLTVKEYLINFDRLDTNGDGAWTLREYSELPSGQTIPDPVKKVFNYYDKLDGNKDGLAQRTELLALYRRINVDGNSIITENELIMFFVEELRNPLSG